MSGHRPEQENWGYWGQLEKGRQNVASLLVQDQDCTVKRMKTTCQVCDLFKMELSQDGTLHTINDGFFFSAQNPSVISRNYRLLPLLLF